jgi:hypothetical protein
LFYEQKKEKYERAMLGGMFEEGLGGGGGGVKKKKKKKKQKLKTTYT